MFIAMLVLTILCLAATIAGFVLIFTNRGQTQRRSGDEVGRELMSEFMEDDEDEATVLAEKTVFKGKAASAEAGVSISLGEIKGMLTSGEWRRALPLLLALGGFLGLFLFGGLAGLAAAESSDGRVIAVVFAGIALYAIVRVGIGIARSEAEME